MGLIGIVVIGRNEGERLIRCLRSLPHHGVRTVYVDSGSTDGSIDAARDNGAQVVPLDLSVPFTAARARNAGIAALRELDDTMDYVQFIDGDCELDPSWIATARDFLEHNSQVAVVCGRRRDRFPQVSIYNAMCDREWDTPVGEAEACGGDALMRWTPLSDVGGYNGALVAGEEPELCARLRVQGWTIWRIGAEMTRHDAALTRFSQWWTRVRRAGFAYAQVASIRQPGVPDVLGAPRRRALIWGFAFPVVTIGTALIAPVAALIVCAAPFAQIVRSALRDTGPLRWTYSAFNMLAKIPEAIGMTQFLVGRLRNREHRAILYK
jgi:GT2 family glycosyltransferase